MANNSKEFTSISLYLMDRDAMRRKAIKQGNVWAQHHNDEYIEEGLCQIDEMDTIDW